MQKSRIKLLTTVLAAVAFLGADVSQANATLLTFDDIPGGSVPGTYAVMPTYQGFTFNTPNSYWIDTVTSGYNYGAHSGNFTLLNNYGAAIIIKDVSGADFTFDGVWAKRWNTSPASGGANSLFGTISGWNNGNSVWSANTGLNGSFQFFGAQAGAIDELRLDFGVYFLADDLSLNGGASPVPEPSTYIAGAMLALVFGVQGLRSRRSRKQMA